MMLETPKLPAMNSRVGSPGSSPRLRSISSWSTWSKNTPCTGMPKGWIFSKGMPKAVSSGIMSSVATT